MNPYFNEDILLRRKAQYQYPEIPKPRIPGSNEILTTEKGIQGQSGVNWGGLATGAAGLLGNYASFSNQFQFDNPAPSQADPTMAPVYTGGNLASQISSQKPQGATGGELLSGAGQGALAGAQFGPVGAAIGGFAGLLSSAFGGNRRRRAQKRARNQAMKSLAQTQQTYNQQDRAFTQQRNAMEDYNDMNNSQARMYNLYKQQR
jgi:hypothetical protein